VLNYLFRANANNSGIYLSSLFGADGLPVYIKKSAVTSQSISKLKREVAGSKWYQHISEEDLISEITDLQKYYSVRFFFVVGCKANFRKGYWFNREYVERALGKYCEIWARLPDNSMVIHGDYSIDNLIFRDDGVTIIDWEHFSYTSIPKGFDALNLIYEQLYILMFNGKLGRKVILHANSMLKKICDHDCLDRVYLESPLETCRYYISNNLEVWGDQVHKLPIMKFDPSRVKEIDSLISIH
jgi:hypothetical protein